MLREFLFLQALIGRSVIVYLVLIAFATPLGFALAAERFFDSCSGVWVTQTEPCPEPTIGDNLTESNLTIANLTASLFGNLTIPLCDVDVCTDPVRFPWWVVPGVPFGLLALTLLWITLSMLNLLPASIAPWCLSTTTLWIECARLRSHPPCSRVRVDERHTFVRAS